MFSLCASPSATPTPSLLAMLRNAISSANAVNTKQNKFASVTSVPNAKRCVSICYLDL